MNIIIKTENFINAVQNEPSIWTTAELNSFLRSFKMVAAPRLTATSRLEQAAMTWSFGNFSHVYIYSSPL